MKQLIVIFVGLLLSTCLLAQQEVKFSVTVGGKTVSLYETLEIRFQVQGAMLKEFKLPEFRGFEVVGGPQQSTSFQYVNGQMSQQASHSYRLRAIKEGTMIIEPASIVVDGKELKTEELRIEVVKDGKIKPPPIKDNSQFFKAEPPTRKKKKKRSTITI